jgi:LuxR family quorum-sensing transcriptional regulator LasR
LHLIDPTVNHSLARLQPLTWNRSTFATDVEHAFYEEASRFGLKSGITFPIHGAHGEFGLISFASDEELTQSDLLTAMMPLAWIRDFVFEASLRVMLADVHAPQRSPLTPRETECLKWLAAGKTSWETSRILMCSEATVNFHVSNIVRKLDVSSRQQAVFKSVREGWVPLG